MKANSSGRHEAGRSGARPRRARGHRGHGSSAASTAIAIGSSAPSATSTPVRRSALGPFAAGVISSEVAVARSAPASAAPRTRRPAARSLKKYASCGAAAAANASTCRPGAASARTFQGAPGHRACATGSGRTGAACSEGFGSAGLDRQRELEVGLAGQADLLALEPVRARREAHGLADGQAGRHRHHDRQQDLALVSVAHERRRRDALGVRPADLAGGEALGQRPLELRGEARVGGVLPVRVPAVGHLEPQPQLTGWPGCSDAVSATRLAWTFLLDACAGKDAREASRPHARRAERSGITPSLREPPGAGWADRVNRRKRLSGAVTTGYVPRHIFVGDVQGCRTELEALLETVRFDPAGDRLEPVGDFVNRGPDSLGTLRLVRSLERRRRAGQPRRAPAPGGAGLRRLAHGDTFEDVLEAPDRADLLEWLAARPFFRDFGDVWLVHAGLDPQLERPGPAARGCGPARRRTTPRLRDPRAPLHEEGQAPATDDPPPAPPFAPWFEHWRGRDVPTIVFGHWASAAWWSSGGCAGSTPGASGADASRPGSRRRTDWCTPAAKAYAAYGA